MHLSHLPQHPVEGAGVGVLALELVFRTAEVIADFAECAFVFLVALEVGLEQGGEVLEGHPLPFPIALDIVSGSRIARLLDDSHQHLTSEVKGTGD